MLSLRKAGIIVLGIVIFLILIRLILPVIIKWKANKELRYLDGYTGHIKDVDLNLYRGAYTIDSLVIEKVNSGIKTPFIISEKVDVSLEWGALLDGALVGEVVMIRPKINFAQGPGEEGLQTGEEHNWVSTAKKLSPFHINSFEIRDGIISYINNFSTPKIYIHLHQVYIVATNLRNTENYTSLLPSTVRGSARSTGGGNFSVDMKINPLKKLPDFDLNLKLERAKISSFNNLLKVYGKFDAEEGNLNFYTELKLKDGKLDGYFKPLITDLKILDWSEEEESFFGKLWEGMVELGTEIFENQDQEIFGTKVPVHGTIDQTDPSLWNAFINMMKNAYIKPLRMTFDKTIKF